MFLFSFDFHLFLYKRIQFYTYIRLLLFSDLGLVFFAFLAAFDVLVHCWFLILSITAEVTFSFMWYVRFYQQLYLIKRVCFFHCWSKFLANFFQFIIFVIMKTFSFLFFVNGNSGQNHPVIVSKIERVQGCNIFYYLSFNTQHVISFISFFCLDWSRSIFWI